MLARGVGDQHPLDFVGAWKKPQDAHLMFSLSRHEEGILLLNSFAVHVEELCRLAQRRSLRPHGVARANGATHPQGLFCASAGCSPPGWPAGFERVSERRKKNDQAEALDLAHVMRNELRCPSRHAAGGSSMSGWAPFCWSFSPICAILCGGDGCDPFVESRRMSRVDRQGGRPLMSKRITTDVTLERDVPVPMSDGVLLSEVFHLYPHWSWT